MRSFWPLTYAPRVTNRSFVMPTGKTILALDYFLSMTARMPA